MEESQLKEMERAIELLRSEYQKANNKSTDWYNGLRYALLVLENQLAHPSRPSIERKIK